MEGKTAKTVKGEKIITDSENYFMFSLNAKKFAFPIIQTKQVLPAENITRVPFTASFIIGLYSLQNKPITIFDLSELLKLKDSRIEGGGKKILFLKTHEEKIFGIIIDGFLGIVPISKQEIIDTKKKIDIPSEYVTGVYRDKKETCILLSVKGIIESAMYKKYKKYKKNVS